MAGERLVYYERAISQEVLDVSDGADVEVAAPQSKGRSNFSSIESSRMMIGALVGSTLLLLVGSPLLMMKLHFNLHTIKCRWIGNGRKGSTSSSPSFITDIFFMLAVTIFLKLISNSNWCY